MGTRGLYGFKSRGQRHGIFVSQDSYPSYLGSQLVHFILSLSPQAREAMAENVRNITWVTNDLEGERKPSLQQIRRGEYLLTVL